MELQKNNTLNFFIVEGSLNKDNVALFMNKFSAIFETVNELTINIKDVESMDKHGVNALAKLHKEALLKKKKFSIIGYGCKELYDHFKTETAA